MLTDHSIRQFDIDRSDRRAEEVLTSDDSVDRSSELLHGCHKTHVETEAPDHIQ